MLNLWVTFGSFFSRWGTFSGRCSLLLPCFDGSRMGAAIMVLIWYLSILRRRQTSHLSPPYPSIRAKSRGGSGFLPVPWHIGGSTTEEGFYIVRLFFGCCSVAAPWYRRLVSSVCGLFCDGWGRVETGGYIGVIFGKRPSFTRKPPFSSPAPLGRIDQSSTMPRR